MPDKKNFTALSEVLNKFKPDENNHSLPPEFSRDKFISREFQKYAYDLAVELGDMKHKALYMRLAKTTPRYLLENARNFVKGAYKVDSRGKLFMWKLSELKRAKLSHKRS